MPEHENDRLEQFFRKAAAKTDVAFNEADWNDLERRLNEMPSGKPAAGGANTRTVMAAVTGALLLIATAVWLSLYNGMPGDDKLTNADVTTGKQLPHDSHRSTIVVVPPHTSEQEKSNRSLIKDRYGVSTRQSEKEKPETREEEHLVVNEGSPLFAEDERNKQKAVVELPGAEEEETRETQTTDQEQHTADEEKNVTAPRLSLLLFFAPDFSGPSMGVSSRPGKAFGAMLQYHASTRWSVSAGIVRNNKVYSAGGDKYHPPSGYWKYYTNGVVPETIDGSCSILEFPIMVHYTLVQSPRSRVNVALGASSYLMQSESYRYHFAQPNPGSKEGWESKSSSRFLFNMLNVSMGYERQIARGLMLGIEPYAKIPVEEIGWSNLKLFSSGAAFTLRYTIIHRQAPVIAGPGRAPD